VVLEPITPPAGTPAGTELLERIRAAEENLASCFIAGDYDGFVALFTPQALASELGIIDPQGTPAHAASYALLREEIISVVDAQTHADGRVSAAVVFAFAGERMRARDIFVETDGWLLLDQIVELPLVPATLAAPAPLDEPMLQNLIILGFPPGEPPGIVSVGTLGGTIGMQPGGTIALVLGVFDYEICGTGQRCFVPVEVGATWSITPTEGAEIDPTTGLLTIDPATASGSLFTARADPNGEQHAVETEVHVSTPEGNPLAGWWREEAQLTCGSGEVIAPELPIAELVFAPDGTFAVTWIPFESYVDYWGTYTFDLTRGTLDVRVTGGNTIPPDVDGQGHFTLDAAGRLILTDLWLGSPRAKSGSPQCGHQFVH
jgi:hypothetical protein